MMERKDHFVIGFCILKVEDNRKYRMHHLNPSQIIAKVRFVSIFKNLKTKRTKVQLVIF